EVVAECRVGRNRVRGHEDLEVPTRGRHDIAAANRDPGPEVKLIAKRISRARERGLPVHVEYLARDAWHDGLAVARVTPRVHPAERRVERLAETAAQLGAPLQPL